MPLNRCLACMQEIEPGIRICPHCHTAIPCPPNDANSLQPGYELGRFVIGKQIGHGGYGKTYIAFDKRLQRIQCIKEFFPNKFRRLSDMSPDVTPEEKVEFDKSSDRFLQEARIMSAMSEHKVPNMVEVFDQLEMNGTTYILMEYLDGCTMDAYITQTQRGLPWREATDVAIAVLSALEGMHKEGYIHRDISLSNIFRLKNGSVRVIDFGSAEPIRTASLHPEQIGTSTKRFYSPPEQLAALPQGPTVDIYALGVCLFKMLAGGWPEVLLEKTFPKALRILFFLEFSIASSSMSFTSVRVVA